MRWAVVGNGALGSLVAIKLQQQGLQVSLCPRQQPAVGHLQLSFSNQHYQLTTTSFEQLEPGTCIFAAVKAYQVQPLLVQLAQAKLLERCPLILSYNGMLTHEQQLLPAQSLFWSTTHGAYRQGSLLVHAGVGQSWLGYSDPQAATANNPPSPWLVPQIQQQLAAALPPLAWSEDMTLVRWHKLATNCLINALTVVYNCPNGDLLRLPVQQLQMQLATEIVALAKHYQLSLNADQLLEQARLVMQRTAANRSSMLSDVRQQRPTEIDYLNGFVAQQSAQLGLAAPANTQLWQQLTEITQGYLGLQ